MKQTYFLLASCFILNWTLQSQDWKNIPVPVKLSNASTWQIQPQSDDFNYQYSHDNVGTEFSKKWTDGYHNKWKGPGLTQWSPESTSVKNGCLTMTASRVKGSIKLALGCITSKERVSYPVYVETKVKISNSLLASDVWMLSPDDTQEIDIVEAYGGDTKENKWFAERIHLSHHMFIREPFKDYQPKDQGSWYTESGNKSWSDEWIRVGVYWRDPFTLEYYINGKLARTTKGQEMIDPNKYSDKGIYKEMDIIINMEDQTWRTNKGLTPSNEDLKNKENHTYLVDWIRVYKPVAKSEVSGTGAAYNTTASNSANTNYSVIEKLKSLNSINVTLTEKEPKKLLAFKAEQKVKKVSIVDQNGKIVFNKKFDLPESYLIVDNLPDGYYKITFKFYAGADIDFRYRKK